MGNALKWTTGVLAAGAASGLLPTLILLSIPCTTVLLPAGNAAVGAAFAEFVAVLALGAWGSRGD